ncbi:hypothetical protein Pcinc_039704 [Petrolisthes cinctipes]|uniref:Protein kinase domain-containing protein n=1 Tax=Petrolisthes cinctipes TaxID=88211 RepID=A0AAE1EKA6_PETCI|nr:hypothetical protein Pcinc_039704 [Petrolisthes cinctipes]
MIKTTRFSVYVSVYLFVCLLGNVALVVLFLNVQPWNRPLYPATARPRKHDWDVTSDRSLGCDDIAAFTNLTVIGSGWTKLVYSGDYHGATVAVKTVHTSGHDMVECTDPPRVCYQQCADKIIKEIGLLKTLAHPNVIKVYGECVPEVIYSPGHPLVGVAAVTEFGHPLSVVHLLQMNFDQRLLLARDVGRLLFHLALSPLGPLLMKDFRREQFVLVDGTLKVSDVDDLNIGDPPCSTSDQCSLKDPTTEETLVTLICNGGECQGFNSRLNALQASQHFLRLLLPYGSPPTLESPAMMLMDRLARGLEDSEAVHQYLENLVTDYSAGRYLTSRQRDKLQEFSVSKGYSIEGADFSCTKTNPNMCQQSVSSPGEAAWLCWQWPQCAAFILLNQWSWTGRQIAIFKSSARDMHKSRRIVLYIRKGQG